MAWIATISGKSQDLGTIEFAVTYADGAKNTRELVKIADGNIDTLKRHIGRRLQQLTDADTLNTGVAVGPFDPTITPAVEDPADIAFRNWSIKLTRLRKVQELINLSVITGNEAQVVALRDDIRTTFLPSYINRF